MGLNLYDTHAMLAAVEVIPPKATFLRDRYFNNTDIFNSQDVTIDFVDEQGNRLAPFVLPTKGGVPVAREGFETEIFTPALVAPERVLTVEDLLHRQAGEALFSGEQAASREANYLRRDIEALNGLIDNREESMAAKVLLNNAYTMKQWGDKYGSGEYVEREIKFYQGASNPAVYTPSAPWSTSSNAIISDIAAMAEINLKRGVPMTDLIVAGDVADVILANDNFLKLLDNRRYILADEVRPQALANGATLIAVINVKGHMVNIFSYTAEYTDEDGVVKAYIPSGKVVMTAPGMGKIAYGSITQLNPDTRSFETFAGKRVPKVTADEHANVRTLTMQSRPLVMPNVRNAAITATVL